MMRSIKTAIIGSGFMGSAHLEAIRRIGGIEVAAIASDDQPRAKQLAELYNIPKIYDNWQKAVNDTDVEVIHNCTPNFLHFEINRAVIKAGKHIISEKPLTIRSKESAELVSLLSKNPVVNAINYNYRMYPLIQQAKNMVHSGQIGDIYLVHGHYLQDWLYYPSDYNWRLETNLSGDSRAVADIGSHWCDLIQFITGMRINRVFGDLNTIHKKRQKSKAAVETFKGKEQTEQSAFDSVTIKTEDTASILLQFDSGAKGTLTVSQVSAGRKNNLRFGIDGSKKALAWDQEEPNQLWIGYREKANEILLKDPSLLDENARGFAHYPGGHPEGYPDGPKNLFSRVYQFIRDGKNPKSDATDFPTFADGHWENKIVEAVLESNKKEQWIEIK
jgi:predicted dehydrogenase